MKATIKELLYSKKNQLDQMKAEGIQPRKELPIKESKLKKSLSEMKGSPKDSSASESKTKATESKGRTESKSKVTETKKEQNIEKPKQVAVFQTLSTISGQNESFQKGFSTAPSTENPDFKLKTLPLQQGVQQVASLVNDMSLKSSEGKAIPRNYPITKIPLSPIHVMLENPEKFDETIRAMCKILNGTLDAEKGFFIAVLDSETSIKASGFKDTITNNIYIEFNRLEGCAFTFQKAFVQAKLSAIDNLKSAKKEEVEEELKLVEERLSFWNAPTLIPKRS